VSRLPAPSPPGPSRLPGTLVARDRDGEPVPLRTIDGMATIRETAAALGLDKLTIRLWVRAFGPGVGARFEPDGPLFVHPHVLATIALLRDARGALPRHACEPGSARHRLVMVAILAAIRAGGVAPPATIARIRHQLGLPPIPKRPAPPPAVRPAAQPAEVRHA
jgi:hypothetical protein